MEAQIKTLYTDKEKSTILLPKTSTKAVSNDEGVGLEALLKNLPYYASGQGEEDDPEVVLSNAESLGGIPADEYASKTFVKEEVLKIQTGGDVDLSEYATKEDLDGLTAQDVGAAPSGYGLGGSAISTPSKDLNEAVNCGWWTIENTTLNRPFNYGMGMTINRYGSRYTQIAFNPFMAGTGEICVREHNGTEWMPWEYINPPMSIGKEYRTTERYQGKPVYVTLFSFGALPNNNDTTIYHVQNNVDQVVSVDMETYDVGGTRFGGLLPNVVGYWAGVTPENDMYLKIKTNADITSYTSHLLVKYTKN